MITELSFMFLFILLLLLLIIFLGGMGWTVVDAEEDGGNRNRAVTRRKWIGKRRIKERNTQSGSFSFPSFCRRGKREEKKVIQIEIACMLGSAFFSFPFLLPSMRANLVMKSYHFFDCFAVLCTLPFIESFPF